MSKLIGENRRDASDRLCFEISNVIALDYPKLIVRIIAQFYLESSAKAVVGPDQIIGGYSDGKCSIGLDWDHWSGFFITALTPEAEVLVRSIGAFLSDAGPCCACSTLLHRVREIVLALLLWEIWTLLLVDSCSAQAYSSRSDSQLLSKEHGNGQGYSCRSRFWAMFSLGQGRSFRRCEQDHQN